jgi:hypothetical protein
MNLDGVIPQGHNHLDPFLVMDFIGVLKNCFDEHACMYVYMYVCVCVHVCICMCVRVRMYVSICVYVSRTLMLKYEN